MAVRAQARHRHRLSRFKGTLRYNAAMSQLTPRQAERRERILRTVRDHLSRFGYEGLSMREVANSAAVSPTTLYNQFQNKDGLILEAQNEVLAQVTSAVAAQQKSGIDHLIASAEAIAEQAVATPKYADAMARMLFNSDPGDPICQVLLGRLVQENRTRIREMLELGEVRKGVDVELLARTLAGDAWSTILLWIKGFIALQDFKSSYLLRLLLTLVPVLTPKTARRYEDLLQPIRG